VLTDEVEAGVLAGVLAGVEAGALPQPASNDTHIAAERTSAAILLPFFFMFNLQ